MLCALRAGSTSENVPSGSLAHPGEKDVPSGSLAHPGEKDVPSGSPAHLGNRTLRQSIPRSGGQEQLCAHQETHQTKQTLRGSEGNDACAIPSPRGDVQLTRPSNDLVVL